MARRFEIVEDPAFRFQIWDNQTEAPVLCGDRLLSFPTRKDAASLCLSLIARGCPCSSGSTGPCATFADMVRAPD